ncbi:Pol polyprotein [Plakobranchus ocellatus]|uniref:Pol polyprotein n=1 Tax=Plakobranchus ocellatus TaxID=259542 RepID=A0AAV4A943_9GAST|nr:Pol polyprotein [Plakobranchus ocellatus]
MYATQKDAAAPDCGLTANEADRKVRSCVRSRNIGDGYDGGNCQESGPVGISSEKREEYLKHEFKLLEERQAREKKEEAERQAREKKEEAERQERKEKEGADRKERLELEKMKLDAEMKLLQLEEVAVTYSSIFSDRPGTASTEEHCIELTSSIPVRQRPYPVPYAMRQTLRDELREMEDLGVIRKSSSPYASPAVVVKKKDSTNRHCLNRGAIGLQDENVEKVKNAPRPKTKREVRAFLGLVGYYKEFVPNFAAVSAPLSDLVRKGQPNIVNWSDSQERAYNSLRVAVMSKPVLQLPDVNKRFVLRTDASDRELGAALMQENEGTLFPVASVTLAKN